MKYLTFEKDDMDRCLIYELALYPVTLFDCNGKRINKKLKLHDLFN